MKIVVDGDACPRSVLHICKKVGRKYGVPVWSVASFHHDIDSDHHVLLGNASQEADMKIINMTDEGGIVVTQDQTLTTRCTGEGSEIFEPGWQVFCKCEVPALMIHLLSFDIDLHDYLSPSAL